MTASDLVVSVRVISKYFLTTIASILVFASAAWAFPISFDPQSYEGKYRILGETGGLTGAQIIDLDAGVYSLRVGSSGFVTLTVDGSGNVSSSNIGAVIGGSQSVTFQNVTVDIDVGDYALNSRGSWRISDVQTFNSTDKPFPPGGVVLVPGLAYAIGIPISTAFLFDIDAAGIVTSQNSVAATGGAATLTFNTAPVLIDPAGYGLNSRASWGFNFVAGSFNRIDSPGPQTVYFVKGVTFHLGLGIIATFPVSVDAAGIASALNGASATGGLNSLTLNTTAVTIDPGDYGLNSSPNWRFQFIHTVDGATNPGPQTVHLVPETSPYFLMLGIGPGFQVTLDGAGNASAVNGVSAVGGNASLDFNIEEITVDPDGYGGSWTVRWIHSSTGVDTVRLVPGVNNYSLQAPVNNAGAFSLDVDGEPVPSTIPLIINSEQFDFLLISGGGVPIADAGADQTVDEGVLVTLDGSQSLDPQGDPLSYSWTQIAGPAVSLVDPLSATPSFVAPTVGANTTLTLQLVVSDGTSSSEPDAVSVSVKNSNNPPVADAGDDATVKAGFTYVLNGSNSFDPDSDPITYQWSQAAGPTVTLSDATGVQPDFQAPLAAGSDLIFKLAVSDGLESSTPSAGADSAFADTVEISVVANSAPAADAGPDQSRAEASLVQLDGSASVDPDGDGISYQWVQVSGPTIALLGDDTVAASFVAPTVSSGGDMIVLSLTVTDDDPFNPLSNTDSVTVNLVNVNDPPSCNLATASIDKLWPPNHKFVEIAIDNVEDPDTGTVGVTLDITGITQDEPIEGTGDGDTGPDGMIISDGMDFDRAEVRSERDGGANGRVYEIAFSATDGQEACTGAVQVQAPKSRKSGAVDDGQVYSSTN